MLCVVCVYLCMCGYVCTHMYKTLCNLILNESYIVIIEKIELFSVDNFEHFILDYKDIKPFSPQMQN